MRRLFVLVFACLLAGSVYATKFAPSKMIDPLSGDEVPAHEIISYGGYIYQWESKYDGVYWPLTSASWIVLNPKNGYAAFNPHFEEITDEDKAALKKWLAENYRPENAPDTYEEKLAWLEQVYRRRKMDNDFWSAFYRLMAYTYRKNDAPKSLEYVKKALPLLHAQLDDGRAGAEKIKVLFLLGEYYRRLGDYEKAREYFSLVKREPYKDKDGTERVGHPYFVGLAEDRERLLT